MALPGNEMPEMVEISQTCHQFLTLNNGDDGAASRVVVMFWV